MFCLLLYHIHRYWAQKTFDFPLQISHTMDIENISHCFSIPIMIIASMHMFQNISYRFLSEFSPFCFCDGLQSKHCWTWRVLSKIQIMSSIHGMHPHKSTVAFGKEWPVITRLLRLCSCKINCNVSLYNHPYPSVGFTWSYFLPLSFSVKLHALMWVCIYHMGELIT